MTKELDIVRADVLSPEESRALDTELDRIIHRYKGNRKEINKLVFESIACMTEADEAQTALSSKGFFKRLWGGFSGDNSRLQNKINENRAAAQYVSQRTLQKLAEQNLMTFDLIAAVNHKLNASLNRVNDEFAYIYEGLLRFFKYNRNELVKLETRIDKLEQNVNLLTWQNSIEYQDLNGVEYAELDTAGKMVCLTKDFYDITKGVWETKDLLLLKTAMSTVDLQPKEQVNYMSVLKTISDRADLKEKLLQGKQLKQIEDPGYLISMGTLGKLDSLKNEESYIVDTVENYLKDNQVPADKEEIGVNLTYKYMAEKAQVNPNIDVNCYDMMLDLLYNLREAEENQLLVLPESEKLKEAEQLYIDGNTKEAFPLFKELAEEGNGRACYFLGEYYKWGYGEVKINKEKAEHYIRKGDALGDALARVNLGYLLPKDSDERIIIFREMFPVILDLAKQGDPVVENELVDLYDGSYGVEKDNEEAFYWALKSAEQGYWRSQYKIGRIYNGGYGVEKDDVKKVEWYRKSAEKGYDWGMYNVAGCYINGEGVEKDGEKAIEWFKKAYEKNGGAAGDAANRIGLIYNGGYGVEKDDVKKVEWYRKSAEKGYDWGMYNVAGCYINGEGVEKDGEKAIEWFKKAYEKNGGAAGDAANRIGLIYNGGYGVEKDDVKKVEWYRKSAEKGYDWGMYNVAGCYINGEGVEKDGEKAIEWFKKAYEKNGGAAGDAANRIGLIYNGGYGVEKDDVKKVEWYRKSAEKGYDWGMYNVAGCYINGEGTDKNVDEAKKWYNKAIEKNGEAVKDARKKLDEL